MGLMSVLKKTPSGKDAWYNFERKMRKKCPPGEHEKAAEKALENAGVKVYSVKIVGHPNKMRAVLPQLVPRFLAVVGDKEALPFLRSPELETTLVARGVGVEEAKSLISKEVMKLESPEDIALVQRLTGLFGGPVGGIRYMRVPKRGGEGTVLVMSPIDLTMVAKNCSYNTAKNCVWKIFKHYFGIDLDSQDNLEHSSVNEVISGDLIYTVRFLTSSRGGQESVALDVQGASELLCLIPGSEVGAQLRRKAVDLMLRVEGGDTSLVDRIMANSKFQQYLQQHDPDHPFRSVGEYAERRHAEQAAPEAQRAAEMELELAHRKRVQDLEFESLQKRRRLEEGRLEIENRRLEIETKSLEDKARLENESATQALDAAKVKAKIEEAKMKDEQHEEFRQYRAVTITKNLEALQKLCPERDGCPLSPRSMLLVKDELRTGILGRERPDPELGRPLYCSKFLKERLKLKDGAARDRSCEFGKDVLIAVRQMFPTYDTKAHTNRSIHGGDREVHLYFDAHLPAFEKALVRYLERSNKINSSELTAEGRETRASGRTQDLRGYFHATSSHRREA